MEFKDIQSHQKKSAFMDLMSTEFEYQRKENNFLLKYLNFEREKKSFWNSQLMLLL
jgi:hypothetical protein